MPTDHTVVAYLDRQHSGQEADLREREHRPSRNQADHEEPYDHQPLNPLASITAIVPQQSPNVTSQAMSPEPAPAPNICVSSFMDAIRELSTD